MITRGKGGRCIIWLYTPFHVNIYIYVYVCKMKIFKWIKGNENQRGKRVFNAVWYAMMWYIHLRLFHNANGCWRWLLQLPQDERSNERYDEGEEESRSKEESHVRQWQITIPRYGKHQTLRCTMQRDTIHDNEVEDSKDDIEDNRVRCCMTERSDVGSVKAIDR